MKFVQVHKLVALCLCLGVARTVARNLRSRWLPSSCIEEGLSCGIGGPQNCCDGLNCVKAVGLDDKMCEGTGHGQGTKNHCIPEGKQCNNGARPHDCCEDLECLLTIDTNGFHCLPVP